MGWSKRLPPLSIENCNVALELATFSAALLSSRSTRLIGYKSFFFLKRQTKRGRHYQHCFLPPLHGILNRFQCAPRKNEKFVSLLSFYLPAAVSAAPDYEILRACQHNKLRGGWVRFGFFKGLYIIIIHIGVSRVISYCNDVYIIIHVLICGFDFLIVLLIS